MTRLVFSGPQAGKRFELLYVALLNGGDGKGDRSAGIIRREARLFNELDAISEPIKDDPDQRRLMDGEHEITVPQEDVDLLLGYAEKTAWVPRAARSAVDLWDWLGNAQHAEKE